MNTAFLLMAQYDAQAVIPVAIVVKDYFPHLSTDKFLRKVAVGEINIPLLRIEAGSQKAATLEHHIAERLGLVIYEAGSVTDWAAA